MRLKSFYIDVSEFCHASFVYNVPTSQSDFFLKNTKPLQVSSFLNDAQTLGPQRRVSCSFHSLDIKADLSLLFLPVPRSEKPSFQLRFIWREGHHIRLTSDAVLNPVTMILS